MEVRGVGEWNSLTLAVAAIPAKITSARMLELAVALGADADHVGHDGAGDGLLLGMELSLLLAHRACRIGEILNASDRDHDALGNRLLR